MSARRSAALGAALLLSVAVPVSTAGPASAAPGRCAPGKGVTVVVDYGPLGGGTVVACDPNGGGKNAPEVMRAAGFSLEGVRTQPQFVCRVNGQPGTSGDYAEDCQDVPPADKYWGLFWSDGDPATWVYASEGASSLDVPDGGSIGWRFQDGGARDNPSAPPTAAKKTPSPPPSSSPSPQPSKPPKAADPTPTPTPTPSASVPPGTVGSGTTPGEKANPGGPSKQPEGKPGGDQGKGDDKGGKGDRGDKNGKKGKDGKPPKDKANPQQAAKPSESPAVTALEPVSNEPSRQDGSSTALTIIAGGAVLLLAGAAGVIGWRRRA